MNEALRQMARQRAASRCEYCRLPDFAPALEPFHLEHITARQHGGATEPENLAWACHRCNLHKGTNLSAIDPDSQEHFKMNGARIQGTTAIGRATVWLLQMNTERRLERRAEVLRLGGMDW